jgi:cytidylate kinase
MPIITISRGSYNRGKEVAEKVAGALGWECISRDSIIDESDQFHDPEIKLVRNIQDATLVLDRFSYGKERYIQTIRASILEAFRRDDVVYHGLAGHHFLGDISHQLKVRIIADLGTRVAEEMKRENISEDQARYILKRDDEERRKWSLYLHGIDTWNPDNYDLVINIGSLTVDDAVEIIRGTAGLPRFQATEASRGKVNDLWIAAKVKSELFQYPNARVAASGGRAFVTVKAPREQEGRITPIIEDIVGRIDGLTGLELRVDPYF